MRATASRGIRWRSEKKILRISWEVKTRSVSTEGLCSVILSSSIGRRVLENVSLGKERDLPICLLKEERYFSCLLNEFKVKGREKAIRYKLK